MRGDSGCPSAYKEGKRPIGNKILDRAVAGSSVPLQRHIETNLPAQFHIHLVLGNHATISIQRAGSPEVHAGTFCSSLCFLSHQIERFFRLITRRAHPASPTS